MRLQKSMTWALAVTALTGLLPSTSLAGEQSETLLLTGVNRGTRSDAKLYGSLETHLRQTGESVVKPAGLSATERLCNSQECLDKLARRENAALAMTVTVNEAAPNSYYLTMALLDVQQGIPEQREALCDGCNADALAIKLDELADTTLRTYREKKRMSAGASTSPAASSAALPLVPSVSPPVNPPVIPQQGERQMRFSPTRIAIASSLGAAALGVLIQSIVWTANNGAAAPAPCSDRPLADQNCHYNNSLASGLGYAGAAVLAGGVALTLFVPCDADKKVKQ